MTVRRDRSSKKKDMLLSSEESKHEGILTLAKVAVTTLLTTLANVNVYESSTEEE